ncbi:MAG: ATP-binding cassette domain-containing protein, partial [Actinobacteria bacterium]|nr:ATP-binding cassette domain-containing protein [Actinomycetota bacterium]
MSGENTRVIDVRNLWKVFGSGSPDSAIARAQAGESRADILSSSGQTVAVRDVSFHVGSGETFVVMGLSGSGKSTLIRCLSRLIEPTRGEVRLNGTDLLAMNDDDLRTVRRGQMSMVFQHFGLFPHRKVIDNIAYGLEVQGIDKDTRRARATEVLGIVGLDGWGDHYPQQLSGGMQQRVGLARALAVDP